MAPLEVLRTHHRSILEQLDRYATELRSDPGGEAALKLERLLRHELAEHARGEEATIYAAVDRLLQAHLIRPTATMSIDHEYIERYIQQIRQTLQLLGCAPQHRTKLAEKLHEQLTALRAILQLHVDKEERVYLPLLEEHLSEAEQEELLRQLHAPQSAEHAEPDEAELDARLIPPALRHPLIFQMFDALEPGGSFILLNDHDPKPLYYQFQFERAGQFEWEYIASGPEEWRVRITKRSTQ